MTEIEAARWLESTPGLTMHTGKDRQLTITNGTTLEVTGRGILHTVMLAQDVLRQMRHDENATHDV